MTTSPVSLQFFNPICLEVFEAQEFQATQPFPWNNLHEFLTPEAFDALYQDFPSLELFEQHSDIPRGGQRPHNRYYLAYGDSIYESGERGKGIVNQQELPQIWQQFMDELQGPIYQKFIAKAFGVSRFKVRYAWHVGFNGCEVSPHVDSSDKIGTHILYFNTSQDWNPAWGGSILVLEGKTVEGSSPDYADFTTATPAKVIDNHSFLFKNSPHSWHGVEPLNCPDEKYRRLFNIIVEYPQARTLLKSPIVQMAKKLIPQPLRSISQQIIPR